ncbi:hypothetical protein HN51_052597 [Arachis hypogaea]|uniref:Uncharacterized protein n=1 Tax=Arachis hypogaea TaxID=3818 RepID=A0A445CA28_ARAHY|nr:nuclear receptor subfamily 4 group A member 3-like [Arachis hypogaea]QHN93971.1 uncharacterized protein DS421_17g597250 [Arachis hypogaea]RYR47796.1 hypothetical protein Ahy_A07g033763 [Arachis hypogaea]
MGVEDGSFRKPGAVPFKWEIKPGVPVHHNHHTYHNHHDHQEPQVQSPEPPSPKLRPPPAGLYPFSLAEPRTRSFRSSPRVRSDRWRFDRPLITRPETVSAGCFFSPLLRRLSSKKAGSKRFAKPDKESQSVSELETLSRWSLSSRKSLSPFRVSTSSSSVASSPRLVGDAEWAGFGLF